MQKHTLRSLSSEKVSTMIPKMMLRPMVVIKMKKETWYTTIGQNVANVLSCSDCFTTYNKNTQLKAPIFHQALLQVIVAEKGKAYTFVTTFASLH